MSPWSDGLSVLIEHIWVVIVILLIILWGGSVIYRILFRFFNDSLSEMDLLSLSVAGWIVPAIFLSIFVFEIYLFFNDSISNVVVISVVVTSSLILIRKGLVSPYFPFFIALLFLLFILRFAFISDLSLPSYFDSAEHYRLINVLTEAYRTGSLPENVRGVFYHLGFHFLIAFISHFLKADILELMLVFGQIILALLPISFFFIIQRETNSTSAALFTCLLAGFGFHMPAHLMNWGKYPALLGLLAAMFTFNLLYILYGKNLSKQRKPVFILLWCSVLTSIFIHSRILILYIILFAAFCFTFGWSRMPIIFRFLTFPVIAVIFAIEFFAIQNNPALRPLLSSYLVNDLWSLILLLPLTIISSIIYPKPTFLIFAWFVLGVMCMFVPISIPIYGVQTLLDRPFVQMFSLIPLSFLAGFGFAGLLRWIPRFLPNSKLVEYFITFSLFGFMLINIAFNYNFYSSRCCRFVTHDDLAAFTWMDKSLPSDARILVASDNFYVTSFETSSNPIGVDAGIWIPQLLSRNIEFAKNETSFDLAESHNKLCSRGIEYIYIGGLPQSFDSARLDSQPLWYFPVFSLPQAKVYQLVGCQK